MANFTRRMTLAALLVTLALVAPSRLAAHCDGLDGPVVKAAEKALAERNVALVLIWVQSKDAPEIRAAFDKTLTVRRLSPQAQALADRFFFETLVRVHRTGEGAPYTGLKPAGRDLGPAIPAADKAVDTGVVEPVVTLLSKSMEDGIRRHFNEVMAAKNFAPNDVEAGRHYIQAYVEFVHYVEGLHQAAASAPHGHYDEKIATLSLREQMFAAPPQRIQILEDSVFSGRRHGVVLVVDDEYSTREILSKWIDAAGFEVYTAPDAETALEILAERDIAVVTVDKDMPGHDGMWLIDKIQQRHPHVAMLLATGDDAISPKVSLSRGVLSYLVKPFEPEAVVRAIVVGVRWHFDALQDAPD